MESPNYEPLTFVSRRLDEIKLTRIVNTLSSINWNYLNDMGLDKALRNSCKQLKHVWIVMIQENN